MEVKSVTRQDAVSRDHAAMQRRVVVVLVLAARGASGPNGVHALLRVAAAAKNEHEQYLRLPQMASNAQVTLQKKETVPCKHATIKLRRIHAPTTSQGRQLHQQGQGPVALSHSHGSVVDTPTVSGTKRTTIVQTVEDMGLAGNFSSELSSSGVSMASMHRRHAVSAVVAFLMRARRKLVVLVFNARDRRFFERLCLTFFI